jgi:hypothetical protein
MSQPKRLSGLAGAALFKFAFTKFLEHWWPVLTALASGGIGAYLASIAAWLSDYGAIAWAAAGLSAAVLMALTLWLGSLVVLNLTLRRFEERRRLASPVNAMQSTYTRERLRVADFFHPYNRPTADVTFERCDLLGPGNVAIMGSFLRDCTFVECRAVIVRPDVGMIGVSGFRDCQFRNCRFFEVNFFMSKAQYEEILATGIVVPIVSDTTAGELPPGNARKVRPQPPGS